MSTIKANRFENTASTGGGIDIDSSGDVGINTTSPDYRLDVNGEVGIKEGQPITWHDGSGNASGQIYTTSDSVMIFRTGVSGMGERMRLLSDGGLTFNGDTGAVNALDDYEEGTFTPSINSGFSASYSNQSGRYTKIGNLVHFFINIDLSALSGSSSNAYARIEGLPFTSINVSNIESAITVGWSMNLGTSVYQAYVQNNSTYIVLLGEPSSGNRTHLSPSQVWDDADAKIAINGFYTTTA